MKSADRAAAVLTPEVPHLDKVSLTSTPPAQHCFASESFAQPVEISLVVFFAKEAGLAVVAALHDVQW